MKTAGRGGIRKGTCGWAPGPQGEDSGKVGWGAGEIVRQKESQGEGQAQGSRATLWPGQGKDQIPMENEREEPLGLPGREEHDQIQWVSK